MTFPDGSRYKGEWKDDKRDGKGKMTLLNGIVYEGGYKDDKENGLGRFLYLGIVYGGEWKDGELIREVPVTSIEWSSVPTQTPKPAEKLSQTKTSRALSAGDEFIFGDYEQDNNKNNGTEKIEWKVLTVEDGRALLISKYGLDSKPYNDIYEDATWETCSLRAWLNGEFYDSAFSASEKEQIQSLELSNLNNSEYGTEGGSVTTDRIFLLSIDEAESYFAADYDKICKGTLYAKENGAYADKDGHTLWWLRSPGDGSAYAAFVDLDGSIDNNGDYIDDNSGIVRPAFWLIL